MNSKSNLRPFQPGQSGNPKGRAPGSRNKLGEAFIEALYADFQEHGVETIAKVREEKPDQYLKVVASLMPRDLNINVSPYEDWTDDELVAAIRSLNEQIIAAREAEEGEMPEPDQVTH